MENQSAQPVITTEPQVTDSRTLISSKTFLILLIVFLIAVVLGSVYLFKVKSVQPKQQITLQNQSSSDSQQTGIKTSYKQWIDCNDVRHVIRDGNRLYVACFGGVLVVDATTNQVIDQITMTQGLGNYTTTSMLKKGSVLYIGTQDGFTKFNLTDKHAEKISIAQGLVNGANILLADDGSDIWIATFDGLSRYSTVTGKITNYRSELADNSTGYEVQNVAVTPNAVYVTVIANVSSPGSIARFDKATQTWERFGPARFNQTELYARIDFFQIVYTGGKVYASDYSDHGNLWVSDDKQGATWVNLTSFNAKFASQTSNIGLVGSNGNDMLVSINNSLYSYDPTADTNTLLLQLQPKDNSPTNYRIVNEDQNQVWISSLTKDTWLTSYNLNTKQKTTYSLVDRPSSFGSILAVVDSVSIIGSGNTLWQYTANNSFKKLAAFENMDVGAGVLGDSGLIFQPIPDTANIFIFSQSCGEGCGEPQMSLYNYASNTIQALTLPQDIVSNIRVTGPHYLAYQSMDFTGFDSQTGIFTFSIGNGNKAVFNSKTRTWQVITVPTPSVTTTANHQSQNSTVLCNQSYTFTANSNTFQSLDCQKTAENADYVWIVGKPQSTVLQTKRNTNKQISLRVPVASPEYTPFKDQKPSVAITSIAYIDNRLWIATDRGLSTYDPANASWNLFSTEEGLPSNDIRNFVVNKNSVWVLTLAGIALLQYK